MNDRSTRLTIVALFLLIPMTVISVVIVVAATQGLGSGYHWWPMGGLGWVFLLIPLTFLSLMFVLVVLAASRPTMWRSYGWPPCGPWARFDRHGAESVLEERYARGDISREEYMRIRNDLDTGRRW
ncbi:MAG: hypothetical protein ABR879_03105 [Methanomassiliicoccales archaeon]|jgi:uncharacterized membrane protein